MGKATMVTLDTNRLKGLLKEKNMSARTLAENLGYSESWGKDLISTGYVKQQTVVAIAKQLGIQVCDLYPTEKYQTDPLSLVSSAPEVPASEETDIMADIDKACRMIVSKALEALEKGAGCIQLEAVANAVSTAHSIVASESAKKELQKTLDKLQNELLKKNGLGGPAQS